jgi:hypothetical protein
MELTLYEQRIAGDRKTVPYRVGDRVRRRDLPEGSIGEVMAFGVRGVHTIATVRFLTCEPTFVWDRFIKVSS